MGSEPVPPSKAVDFGRFWQLRHQLRRPPTLCRPRSLARPGGKATGVTFMSVELNPKRIDFVRTALPKARKIGLLSNVNHFGEENEIAACQTAVQQAGVELTVYRVSVLPGPPTLYQSLLAALEAGGVKDPSDRFSYSYSGSPSTVQRRKSRRSSFGKSVRA